MVSTLPEGGDSGRKGSLGQGSVAAGTGGAHSLVACVGQALLPPGASGHVPTCMLPTSPKAGRPRPWEVTCKVTSRTDPQTCVHCENSNKGVGTSLPCVDTCPQVHTPDHFSQLIAPVKAPSSPFPVIPSSPLSRGRGDRFTEPGAQWSHPGAGRAMPPPLFGPGAPPFLVAPSWPLTSEASPQCVRWARPAGRAVCLGRKCLLSCHLALSFVAGPHRRCGGRSWGILVVFSCGGAWPPQGWASGNLQPAGASWELGGEGDRPTQI